NFRIHSQTLGPELDWLISRRFRMSGSVNVERKRSEGGESNQGMALFREAGLQLTGNTAKGSLLGATFRYVNIDYDKPENPYVEYELLEALRPGANFTWRVNVQQELLPGLKLSLNYDGRKSEDSRTIHFGRMQLAAFF